MSEAGLPGFVVRSGFSLLGPAGLPRPIVDKLNGALVKSLADADTRMLIITRGADPVGNTPAEHTAYLREVIEKWMRVVREAGIAAE